MKTRFVIHQEKLYNLWPRHKWAHFISSSFSSKECLSALTIPFTLRSWFPLLSHCFKIPVWCILFLDVFVFPNNILHYLIDPNLDYGQVILLAFELAFVFSIQKHMLFALSFHDSSILSPFRNFCDQIAINSFSWHDIPYWDSPTIHFTMVLTG